MVRRWLLAVSVSHRQAPEPEKTAESQDRAAKILDYHLNHKLQYTDTPGSGALVREKEREDFDGMMFDDFEDCPKMKWDQRETWKIDTMKRKALLGSPNGRGFGFLLTQNKKTFGEGTRITAVTAWCSYEEGASDDLPDYVNLRFHVSEPVWKVEEDHEAPP